MCCVQFDVGLHGHQQACVARVQLVTLHDISKCDVPFFGVQFVLSVAIVPFGAQGQLRRSRDKG